ncbi:MAG TPA: S8 family serine peptidase [Symbiobacteriaceae bacterium]|nr:S8 family serine peptidase [Symbiobacteriaceae bacterium]
MQRLKRTLSMGLFAILLAGLISGAAPRLPAGVNEEVRRPAEIPNAISTLFEQVNGSENPFVDLDLLVEKGSDQTRVKEAVVAAGGEITVQEQTFLRVRLPVAAAGDLPKLAEVKGVGVNQPLQIDPTGVSAEAQPVNAAQAAASAKANLDPIGVEAFRGEFNAQGNGVIVAVIDSGVDPGHPALMTTPDGRPKIIDWKNFTREGRVLTTEKVTWQSGVYATSDGRQYRLPNVDNTATPAYFGYLDEQYVYGYINQDLDRNGLKIDRFGVLVTAGQRGGAYDTVFIDTNRDGDFRDEAPLTVFRQGHSFTRLGEYRDGLRGAQRLNVAVADINPDGQFVSVGFDGLGHGTWVSGIIGAAAPNGGFQGVAPGVQIMALKALSSTGSGDWWDIKKAILYAADNGASIINLSVGDLATGAAKVFDTGASEWLNQIATQYGVLIVLAAGNSGPGLSSGTTIGSPSQVIAAGAYFSPEMWKRDYGWSVPHESIWFFSGMGPRSDGTYLPSLVAPGGSPAPSPFWRDVTGYTTAVGTSVATPHVSGAAALLMEAGRGNGISYDWLSVKRALEMGARHITGFAVYEQGSGLVQLRAAYSHLEQIDSRPALSARTLDGQGGILARSYAPGSTSLSLTNADTDHARVTLYSSEPWMRPAFSSMLLPSNKSRQLPLQFDPPRDPGVHSAFVTVTHQNHYGPSLLLPVTYVQPVQLGSATDYGDTRADTLEAGRYRRYFFEVPPGAASFAVTARMPFSQTATGNGTIQMHVFRPDGQVLHTGKFGLAGEGLSTLFQTDDPLPGVWEVVLVALPDQRAENANPAYTLEARTRPGALGNQPLKFSVAPGSVTAVPIKVNNVFGPFTGSLAGVGLVKSDDKDAWGRSVPWRMQLKRETVVETFTVKEFVSDIQIQVSNPTRADMNVPAEADPDLSLYLYKILDDGTKEQKAVSMHAGTSRETILYSSVSPGTYRVVVTSSTDGVQYQYRRLMGVDRFQVGIKDEPRQHAAGDVWTPTLTIMAPTSPGRYFGYLMVQDTARGNILGWYPFEVSVGQPALSIRPMDAQLTRGKDSNVVFETRDSRNNRLVSGVSIMVNGQKYLSVNGQVTVQVAPQGETHVLTVEADVPSYQYFKGQFTLPVKEAWGLHPLGIDKDEENSNWRRKVINQLP